MYSMQRQKAAVELSVDQAKLFNRFSQNMNKIKLFKALKLNIFLKFQFYNTNTSMLHLECHINKNNKFMKKFRLLRYLIYRFIMVHYTTHVNGKVIK